MDNEKSEKFEKMVLSHEPVPGYQLALVIAVTVAVAYLGYIFITSLLA
ncbi:MAG: hypothetical protein JRI38_01600 [Deltaproteobacteria bacterium]|nr:hypothetical protein [Deltaproteobacteria bacterium]